MGGRGGNAKTIISPNTSFGDITTVNAAHHTHTSGKFYHQQLL